MDWIQLDFDDIKTFPPVRKLVLAVDTKQTVPCVDLAVFYYQENNMNDWESYAGQLEVPTHWCPFPELPKKDQYGEENKE